MRLKIISLFVFFCSIIFAQNNFKKFNHLETDIKLFINGNGIRGNFFLPNNITTQRHSFVNLSGQLLVGSGLSVVFSIIPLGVAWADTWSGKSNGISQAALGVITLSSYFFGAAVGVHWVAKSENPELSFWNTFAYSAISGGAGLVLLLILASHDKNIPAVGGTIVALSPVIGSMVYASFISNWPQKNVEISFYKKFSSHKDLVEHTKLFNIELLRIKL